MTFGPYYNGATFIAAALTAVISRPTNLIADTSQCEMVTARVVEVRESSLIGRYIRSDHYTVILDYQGEEYKMGPLSGAAYAEGVSYEFCLLNGKFYPTAVDAENALVDQASNPVYKISMPGAFVIAIAWIYCFTAFWQSRKKLQTGKKFPR